MGLVGLIRTILILLAVYYGYKFAKKYVIPLMFGNHKNKPFNNQQNYSQFQKNKEGNVTIRYNRNQKDKKVDEDEGEYVDYEEVN